MLSLLDDVCNFPKGSDDKFLQKLGETYNQHAHFTMAGAANEFTIKHYAGDVLSFFKKFFQSILKCTITGELQC